MVNGFEGDQLPTGADGVNFTGNGSSQAGAMSGRQGCTGNRPGRNG
ncbi:hypothetical protein O982_10080 [Mycobacterium avium 10-5581]|nr:hypothetical protein O982_10080 [Mycobacterium avium 10-5581]